MERLSIIDNYVNLTAVGTANTTLLLQNQGIAPITIVKSVTKPDNSAAAYILFEKKELVVDNSAGDIWVADTGHGGNLFVDTYSPLPVISDAIPNDLYTSDKEGFRRLRVDTGQTGFFEGREFRTFHEFNIPPGQVQTVKFVAPVDFILWEQTLSLDAGSIRMEVFTGATDIASFATALPRFGKNRMADRPSPLYEPVITLTTHLVPVALGSSVNIASATLVDKLRLVAANATAQQQTVSGAAQSERGLPAGTYHLRLHNFGTGAATGMFYLIWEERP